MVLESWRNFSHLVADPSCRLPVLMMLKSCNYVIVIYAGKKENTVENVMLVYAQTVVSVSTAVINPSL